MILIILYQFRRKSCSEIETTPYWKLFARSQTMTSIKLKICIGRQKL